MNSFLGGMPKKPDFNFDVSFLDSSPEEDQLQNYQIFLRIDEKTMKLGKEKTSLVCKRTISMTFLNLSR